MLFIMSRRQLDFRGLRLLSGNLVDVGMSCAMYSTCNLLTPARAFSQGNIDAIKTILDSLDENVRWQAGTLEPFTTTSEFFLSTVCDSEE